MQFLKFFIFTLCMFNIAFTADECDEINPSKKSDCTDYKISEIEKSEGADSCCYNIKIIKIKIIKYVNTQLKSLLQKIILSYS